MIFIFLSLIIDERLTKNSLFKSEFVETLYSEDKRYIFKGSLSIWEKGFRIEVTEPFIQVIIGQKNLEVYTRGVDFPSVYDNKFPLNRILFHLEEFMASYEEKNGYIQIIPKDTLYVKKVAVWKENTIKKIELNLVSQRMVFVIKNVKIIKKFNENLLLSRPLWE